MACPHPWSAASCSQTPSHPDPLGATLATLRSCLRNMDRASELGLFWDWASLSQKPRSAEEESLFRVVLDVMLFLYASVTGTAVLQCKEVPQRPAQYDGRLCIFGESEASDELRRELARLGGSEDAEAACIVEATPYGFVRATFNEHIQAERVVAELARRGRKAALEYNDRPYDGDGGRGWCIAEQGASKAVAAHLSAASQQDGGLPERFRMAEESGRAKLAEISASGELHMVDVLAVPSMPLGFMRGDEATPARHLHEALEAIKNATFTGKGDKPKVQMLLAKLEWTIRTAFEEAAVGSGHEGQTIDPKIVRERRQAEHAQARMGLDEDGTELLAESPI